MGPIQTSRTASAWLMESPLLHPLSLTTYDAYLSWVALAHTFSPSTQEAKAGLREKSFLTELVDTRIQMFGLVFLYWLCSCCVAELNSGSGFFPQTFRCCARSPHCPVSGPQSSLTSPAESIASFNQSFKVRLPSQRKRKRERVKEREKETLKSKGLRRWGDGSVAERAHCSSKEPGFYSQHLEAHSYL